MWVLAPHSSCRLLPAFANADEVCRTALNAASSQSTTARHRAGSVVGAKWLGQVNGLCGPLY